jgi:hypothetical protein
MLVEKTWKAESGKVSIKPALVLSRSRRTKARFLQQHLMFRKVCIVKSMQCSYAYDDCEKKPVRIDLGLSAFLQYHPIDSNPPNSCTNNSRCGTCDRWCSEVSRKAVRRRLLDNQQDNSFCRVMNATLRSAIENDAFHSWIFSFEDTDLASVWDDPSSAGQSSRESSTPPQVPVFKTIV